MDWEPDPRTYRWPAHADTQAGDFKPHLPGAAPMSFQITENFVQQFGTNFRILGQQRRSRLWARSEEHTSELQSLMRISYAVFCLKKKTTYTHIKYSHTRQSSR